MQLWCDWQLTLCDPHLSALEVRFHEDALYKSMFTFTFTFKSNSSTIHIAVQLLHTYTVQYSIQQPTITYRLHRDTEYQ